MTNGEADAADDVMADLVGVAKAEEEGDVMADLVGVAKADEEGDVMADTEGDVMLPWRVRQGETRTSNRDGQRRSADLTEPAGEYLWARSE